MLVKNGMQQQFFHRGWPKAPPLSQPPWNKKQIILTTIQIDSENYPNMSFTLQNKFQTSVPDTLKRENLCERYQL